MRIVSEVAEFAEELGRSTDKVGMFAGEPSSLLVDRPGRLAVASPR